MRQCSAIVLVVFSWVDLVADELCRFNLGGLGEEIRWLSKLTKLNFGNLVHLLESVDVSLEFRSSGRSCGKVFARLVII